MKNRNALWMVILLLISFLIGMWMENGSDSIYTTYLEPIMSFEIPIILVILVSVVLYQFYSSKINFYEQENTEFKQQVKDGSRALWKYFKDIGEIKVKEIILDVMESSLKKNEHILAIQIYEYSIRHLKEHTILYVTHKYSHVAEETDINALLQTYYKIPKELYDSYCDVKTLLKSQFFMEDDIIRVSQWCEEHLSVIQNKGIDDLKEEDSIRYALIEIILDIVSLVLEDDFTHEFPQDKIRRLNSLKRTGILKSVLVDDFYTFEYKGVSNKNGRKYLTKVIHDEQILNGVPHVILITMNADYLPTEPLEHDEFLFHIGEEFNETLQKELEIRYNEFKDTMNS